MNLFRQEREADWRTRKTQGTMKTCYFCKGTVTPKTVEFDGKWGTKRVILTDVPAEVCHQCGERYFSPEVSKRLEELATLEKVPDESSVQVPVRSFRVVA